MSYKGTPITFLDSQAMYQGGRFGRSAQTCTLRGQNGYRRRYLATASVPELTSSFS